MGGKTCIVLTSSMATGLNLTAQKNMVDKLDGQKVVFENVEAVQQVDKRNELFEISGKKGLFPQVSLSVPSISRRILHH